MGCGIKQFNDGPFAEGPAIGFDIEGIYQKILNPAGTDIKNYVLQYLEEGLIDLVCLMTPLAKKRCDVIRCVRDVNTYSTCWQAAWTLLATENGWDPTAATTF